jgi:hypothetical protein
VKDYVVRDPIAVGYLNAVSRSKRLAFQRTQCKKAVEQTLGVANGHFFCGQSTRVKQSGNQQEGDRPQAETETGVQHRCLQSRTRC